MWFKNATVLNVRHSKPLSICFDNGLQKNFDEPRGIFGQAALKLP